MTIFKNILMNDGSAYLGHIDSVAKNAITGDVSSAMGAVFLHHSCSDAIQPRHRCRGALKRLDAFLRREDVGNFVPKCMLLVHPLMRVDGDLSAERFGKD